MKVLFLPQTSQSGPASRYRIYQYLDFFKNSGIDYEVRPFVPEWAYGMVYARNSLLNKIPYFGLFFLGRVMDLAFVGNYNAVFLQREILSQAYPVLEEIIAKLNSNLIFDFDDSIFLSPPQGKSLLYRFRCQEAIPKILRMARAVIAGNNYLKEYALKYNNNVSFIPTSIDTGRYRLKDRASKAGITIGWMGSPYTIFYLDELKDIFTALAKRYKIRLSVIGIEGYSINGVEVISRKWNLEREVDDLHGFDIGVTPLIDDEWGRGKCGCKTLQYMAVGIPVVASPVGANNDIIIDGFDGYLASSREDWIEKLSLLIEDGGLRQRLGLEGRRKVEERYSVAVNAPKLLAIIRAVGSGNTENVL